MSNQQGKTPNQQTKSKVPTKDQFSDWKHSPVGAWFFDVWLQSYFQAYTQEIIEGATINVESMEDTALNTLRHQTKASMLHEIGFTTYEEMLTMLGISAEEIINDED